MDVGGRRTGMKPLGFRALVTPLEDCHARVIASPSSGISISRTIPTTSAGENPMPWVRLHGTKDYWGMAMHLKEVPEMHATINLVPSLLVQILAYTDGGQQDEHLRVSRLPADGLSEADRLLPARQFLHGPSGPDDPALSALPRAVSEARPGGRHGRAGRASGSRRRTFSTCNAGQPGLDPSAGLRAATPTWPSSATRASTGPRTKSSGCSTSRWSCCAEVIPLHRELAERGPGRADHHAVLSSDPAAVVRQAAGAAGDARRRAAAAIWKAMPRTPRRRFAGRSSITREAVRQQAARHVALGRLGLPGDHSGRSPRPASSGSPPTRRSSPARPTAGSRATRRAIVRNPEMLYRPWRVEEAGQVAADRLPRPRLSDQIGFHYQRYEAEQAVDDFIGKLEAIGRATGGNAGHRPTLVSIILDGENCWEYYPNGGVEFLARLVSPRGRSIRRSSRCASRDYLATHPATDKLGHLFAGSWISHNFGIWIGHPECNRPGTCCPRPRAVLVARAADGEVPPSRSGAGLGRTVHRRGERLVLVVRRQSLQRQDGLFDRLFRKHLQNVYTLLGRDSRRRNCSSRSAGDTATAAALSRSRPAC